METFHRIIEVDDDRQVLPKEAAKTAACLLGIPEPPVKYMVMTSPGRGSDLLITPSRAHGCVRGGTVFLRTDVLSEPAMTVRIVFHETYHVFQMMNACRTLKTSYSTEADERGARLFVYENLSDLRDNATHDECMRFLEKLKQKQSQQLRVKFAPMLKQMTKRYENTSKWRA
jgi:hypothetical protein